MPNLNLYAPGLKNDDPEERAKLISKEFEDFAYIVSHDLNAPLRHIREFTKLLVGSRKGDLSDDEREYIDFLEISLDKISRMQEALLAFSRLNTQASVMRDVDCNKVMENVLSDLQEEIDRRKAQVRIANLPTVTGDSKQLHLLFRHLLDNALKFHNFEDNIIVNLDVETNKNEHIFSITDNGIGVEPRYHEEVFRFFRRLNVGKFAGIGAGLPIAKKIVQRHGGRIWMQSEQGKGATVFFTLPK